MALADLRRQMRRDFGLVPEPVTLHAPVPELLAGTWCVLRETLVAGAAPRPLKEAVALAISRANRCPYCVDAHSILLGATAEGGSAEVPGGARDRRATDSSLAAVSRWAAATGRGDSKELRSPPFPREHAPEYFGTAMAFHYINRMVLVRLGASPIPFRSRWLKGPLERISSWMLSGAVRAPKEAGASLPFLPEAELPADLAWASSSPVVAAALARWSAAVERSVEGLLPIGAREAVGKVVERWRGGPPFGLERKLEEIGGGLAPADRVVSRLALLVALAPHRIDEGELAPLREAYPGDAPLISILAWGSLAAARRIAGWIAARAPSREA
ncbi:MAG: carboxymuconolactone decarboxylase family protein [Planctomycetota bacterium]